MASVSRSTRPSGCYLGLDACYPSSISTNAAASRTCSPASQLPASLGRHPRPVLLTRRPQLWTQSPSQYEQPYRAKSLPSHPSPLKILPRILCPANDHSHFQQRPSNAPSLQPHHLHPPLQRGRRHSKDSSSQSPPRATRTASPLRTRQSPVSHPATMEHHHLQRPVHTRVSPLTPQEPPPSPSNPIPIPKSLQQRSVLRSPHPASFKQTPSLIPSSAKKIGTSSSPRNPLPAATATKNHVLA